MTQSIDRLQKGWRGLARLVPGAALVLLLTACQMHKIHTPLEARYKPSNIYSRSPVLNPEVKRVAVLPMTGLQSTEAFQAGVESLQPLLDNELDKAKRFELIVVTPEELRRWTGQRLWRAEEQLPPDFFERLHEETGCQAVLFDQLSRYQPYQPIAVGWKLTLVVNKEHQIYWAADEIFDAGDDAVANAARVYAFDHITTQSPIPDPNAILSSPSRFGQYTLHALFATLPQR
jgi:hypothetical protein